MQHKTNFQLMARCTYNPATHKANYENFLRYYPSITKQ